MNEGPHWSRWRAEEQRLPVDHLHELFDYNTETGVLYWRPRSAKWFKAIQYMYPWNARFAGKPAGHVGAHGYSSVRVHPRYYRAHRIIMAMQLGHWPKHQVDHIDQDRGNNRLHNLREASFVDNAKNHSRHKSNTSGVTGVHWSRRDSVWIAKVGHGNNRIHLGSFQSLDDAAEARRKAERIYGFSPRHGSAVAS